MPIFGAISGIFNTIGSIFGGGSKQVQPPPPPPPQPQVPWIPIVLILGVVLIIVFLPKR